MSRLSISLTPVKGKQSKGCENCGLRDRQLYAMKVKAGRNVNHLKRMCSLCARHRIFGSPCWMAMDVPVTVEKYMLEESE